MSEDFICEILQSQCARTRKAFKIKTMSGREYGSMVSVSTRTHTNTHVNHTQFESCGSVDNEMSHIINSIYYRGSSYIGLTWWQRKNFIGISLNILYTYIQFDVVRRSLLSHVETSVTMFWFRLFDILCFCADS